MACRPLNRARVFSPRAALVACAVAGTAFFGPPLLAQAPPPAAIPVGQGCQYPCKAQRVQTQPWHATDHINVRFNTGIVAREQGGLIGDRGTGSLAGPDVQAALAKYAAAGCKWMRVHSAVGEEFLDQLQANAEKALGRSVANLNQDFFLYFPRPLDVAGLDAAIDDFNALGIVEMAEPALAPAPLPTAPDYKGNQHYLYPSDNGGVNAYGVRLFPGGYGENVRVCDLEYSWNLSHQDLPAITTLGGPGVDPYNDTNHGTAVLGELFGRENGSGVTGGVPSAVPYVAPTNFSTGYNVAQAITNALTRLVQGDVIIIEQQIGGPNFTGIPSGTQFGLVPVEWNLGIFNAVVTAIGNGVHVVMAAGNGTQNLDSSSYTTGNGGHHPFVSGSGSGSIIVGAGAAQNGSTTERSRLGFSNWGSRLNLQGWGESVYTLGYADAYSAEGQNLWYTAGFGGTSSATPIVTSAVAVYNSIMESYSSAPNPSFTRSFLVAFGLAQTSGVNPSSQNIGVRPDVLATINGTMLAAPANNNCASAVLLGSPGYGYTTGRVVNATTDGAGSCATGGRDVWYRFVAPSFVGNLWVSTCGTHDVGQLDTGLDTTLAAFSACGGTEQGCNDDDFVNPTGCGFNNGIVRDASLVIPMTPGAQTYIRVANYSTAVPGAFALGWIYVPINDNCANAIDVSGGGVFTGNLTNSHTDGAASCGSSNSNGDIWYRFNACAAGTLALSTCGTNDMGGVDLGVDTVLSIYGSCGGTQIDCNDDAPNSNCGNADIGNLIRDSYLQRTVAPGDTVLIRVSKYSTTAVGPIRLSVTFTQSHDCAFNPYVAVTGDNPFCNAGTSGVGLTESICPGNANIYNSVFFSYVAPVGGALTFSVCDAGFDTKMAVYAFAGCSIFNNQAAFCNDDYPGCGSASTPNLGSRITTTATAGQAFKVRVGAYATGGYGSGTLHIDLAGSDGACCRGTSCAVLSQGACVAGPYGGAVWTGGTACNAAGNNLTPCCRADFNHAGGVSVQDIFDFLAAYFGSDPTADFNGLGGVSVQDIFDFLSAYFAGC